MSYQSFESGTLCVLRSDGKIVGAGFLISPNLVVTCAHVIVAAGALDGDTLQVQFSGRNEKLNALVEPEYWREMDQGDVAFLRLDAIPVGIEPLRLAAAQTCLPGSVFRSFGYATAADVQGIHANGIIDGYLSQHRLLQLQSPQANHGISGGPVFDESRRVVVGMITKGHVELGRNEQTTFATPTELLFEICPEIRPSETCPYLGLESFTAETARFFFGREALIEKLLTTLRKGCRFLTVLGPSGSGKSSVVRAGLLPKLERGLFADWRQVIMRPADDPFKQLKAAGMESFNRGTERIILFIDQFEELFTLCPDDQRAEFVAALETALENSRFMLLLSMRDDFYSAFNAKAAALAQSGQLKIENVPGLLKSDELVAMIERPAAAVGLALEEGLTAHVVKDLTREGEARSSTLPLLEFALTQLWEQRRDGWLTHAAYQTIGGVTGSLARWADEAYSDLPKAEHPLAESLLISLVHPGDEARGLPDTRRRRALEEFDETNLRVVRHFADRRLLVTSGEAVELVHDALLREWERLRSWLNDDRDNLRLREGISEAAKAWSADQKNLGLLVHSGERLSGVLRLRGSLNAQEQWYLDNCKQLGKMRRNLVIFILLGILAILVGWGLTSTNSANERAAQAAIAQTSQANAEYAKATAVGEANIRATAQANAESAQANAEAQRKEVEKQSQIALARQLAAQAQLLYTGNDLKKIPALLLATQSMRMFPVAEASEILQKNSIVFPVMSVNFGGGITVVTFSSDSRYVAVGGYNQTIRIWEIATGVEIARIKQNGLITSIGFSPDSKYLASGSQFGDVYVWEVSSGKEIVHVPPENSLNSVTLNQDAVSGTWISTVIFSPDGKYVVSGSYDGIARVLEAYTGKEIARVKHNNWINSIALSSDGKYVVSGSQDGVTRVWEINTGKEISKNTESTPISSVAFSPDGKYVVSGGCSQLEFDKNKDCIHSTIVVWEPSTGVEIARKTLDYEVSFVTFSPNGKYVISRGLSSFFSILDAYTGQEIIRLSHDSRVTSVAFSSDNQYVISGSKDGTARIWDVITGEEMARIVSDNLVTAVNFSPNGQYIVSGNDNGIVRVWELVARSKIALIEQDDAVTSVTSSPDGKIIVSGSEDGVVRIWEANTGKEMAHMKHDEQVTSVAFSPDGRYVASGSKDKTVRVWEVNTGTEIFSIVHSSAVTSVAFNLDGKFLVSGSEDGVVRIWEVNTRKEVAHIKVNDQVTSVSFSLDSRYVAAGSRDNTVHVWEVNTGIEIFSVEHLSEVMLVNGVTSVAFSPDGKFIVSGSKDGTARVWELSTDKEIIRVKHNGMVNSVAFSPNGKYVVSGSQDGIVHVWEIKTGKEINLFAHTESVNSVVFTWDGQYVISGGVDKKIHIWIWSPEKLIDSACLRAGRNLTKLEWNLYLGDALPYQAVCPNLPIESEPTATPTP